MLYCPLPGTEFQSQHILLTSPLMTNDGGHCHGPCGNGLAVISIKTRIVSDIYFTQHKNVFGR